MKTFKKLALVFIFLCTVSALISCKAGKENKKKQKLIAVKTTSAKEIRLTDVPREFRDIGR